MSSTGSPGRRSLAALGGRGPVTTGGGRLRLAGQPLGFWLAAVWLAALVFFVLFAPVLGFLADPDG
ncbi:MAG: hypothetical protein OXG69_13590, partial [bacterium]|nr:hypothetical protein [bacterium]